MYRFDIDTIESHGCLSNNSRRGFRTIMLRVVGPKLVVIFVFSFSRAYQDRLASGLGASQN